MFELASEGKYREACDFAARIHGMTMFEREKQLWAIAEHTNNYGFCLMNSGDYDEAKSMLTETKDIIPISELNNAILLYKVGEHEEAKSILKKMIRKEKGVNERASFINLIYDSDSKMGYEIVRNVLVYNAVVWNLVLMLVKDGESENIVYSYLKKYKGSKEENSIHDRVKKTVKDAY